MGRCSGERLFDGGPRIPGHAAVSEAEAAYRKCIAIWEDLVRQQPVEVRMARNLNIAYVDLANLRFHPDRPSQGDARASVEILRQALRMREAGAAADPADVTARRDIAIVLTRLGCRALAPEIAAEGLSALERAESIFTTTYRRSGCGAPGSRWRRCCRAGRNRVRHSGRPRLPGTSMPQPCRRRFRWTATVWRAMRGCARRRRDLAGPRAPASGLRSITA